MSFASRLLSRRGTFVQRPNGPEGRCHRLLSRTKGSAAGQKSPAQVAGQKGQKVVVSPYATAFVRFVLLSTRSQKAYLLNPSLSFVLLSRPARNACVRACARGGTDKRTKVPGDPQTIRCHDAHVRVVRDVRATFDAVANPSPRPRHAASRRPTGRLPFWQPAIGTSRPKSTRDPAGSTSQPRHSLFSLSEVPEPCFRKDSP